MQTPLMARIGWWMKVLNFKRERIKYTFVRKRARRGIERRYWWREAVRHEGDLEWRSAQDKEEIEGWAEDVTADMDCRESGRVFGFDGWRIGEMKALL